MKHIQDYIKILASYGKRSFTTQEAQAFLGGTRNATNLALHRLKQKNNIASPSRNFYLIIPPEFQILGCLPPDHLIPLLMNYWNEHYYVGLLSAATYYAAAHQQPQVFQVMTEKQHRQIQCGKVRVQFIKNKYLSHGKTQQMMVPTGYLTVSTPETTAMDLLNYPQQAGGLNHIATVLTELVETIDGENLLKLMKQSHTTAWIQRLGYLLEIIDPEDKTHKNEIIALLQRYIEEKKPLTVALNPNISMTGSPRNPIWNVVINSEVESDI